MVGNLDNSPVHIKSINRESASEQVYQQMKHLIDTQVWAPGYKIPSENQLASQFGVMSIPALLVFRDGKLVNQAVGARPKAGVLALLG